MSLWKPGAWAGALANFGERELRPRIRAIGVDLGLLALALLVLTASFAVVVVALYLLLARALEPWLAALLTAGALLGLALALLLVVRARTRSAGSVHHGRRRGSAAPFGDPGALYDDSHAFGDPRGASDEAVLREAFARAQARPGVLVLACLAAGVLVGMRRRKRDAARER